MRGSNAPHGTNARYQAPCRCAPCRAASRDYQRIRLRAMQRLAKLHPEDFQRLRDEEAARLGE